MAGSSRTAAWSQPHRGAPSQSSMKIPPGSGREELGVCPFPGSTHPISLPLLTSCSSAPKHAVALQKVTWPCWLAVPGSQGS